MIIVTGLQAISASMVQVLKVSFVPMSRIGMVTLMDGLKRNTRVQVLIFTFRNFYGDESDLFACIRGMLNELLISFNFTLRMIHWNILGFCEVQTAREEIDRLLEANARSNGPRGLGTARLPR
jgi:hypothetical protein